MLPDGLRKDRALVRGRKKVVEKRIDYKNDIQTILNQNGITYEGNL